MEVDTGIPLRPLHGETENQSPNGFHESNDKFCMTEENGVLKVSMKVHFGDCFTVMNQLRDSGQLCDVTLVTSDGEKMDAHKIVLCSSSPYFKAMFTNGMIESTLREIHLQAINSEALSILIDFCYTGKLLINQSNVCALLSGALLLQILKAQEACCIFLDRQLHPTNALGIASYAQQFGCLQLKSKAERFTRCHFLSVSQEDEFMGLTVTQLSKLLNDDYIHVNSEHVVWDALLRWINHDPEKRTQKFEQLVQCVRCHLLPCHIIQDHLENNPLVTPGVRDHLQTIWNDQLSHKPVLSQVKQRLCQSTIFIVGGYLRHSLDNVESFNPLAAGAQAHSELSLPPGPAWRDLPPLPTPKSGLGACVVHNKLYAIGGRNNSRDGNIDSETVHVFDPCVGTTGQWYECASMHLPRNRVCVGVLDDFIYAIGGSQGPTHHTSVERYDQRVDKWILVAPLNRKRIGAGVAVLDRFLYCVGGFDGVVRLKSVEVYDPERNKWSFVAPMNNTRSGAGIAALNGKIYAVGGYNSTQQLCCVERYDPATDQWSFVSPMVHPRSALPMAVVADRLYAVGGYSGSDFMSSIETYDPDTDTWRVLDYMTTARSGHGVAVGVLPVAAFPQESVATPSHEPARTFSPTARHAPSSSSVGGRHRLRLPAHQQATYRRVASSSPELSDSTNSSVADLVNHPQPVVHPSNFASTSGFSAS